MAVVIEDATPLTPAEAPIAADWETVAEEVTAAIQAKVEPLVRTVADDIYERLMVTVQGYLADNVRFNLASTLDAARREAALLREKLDRAWRAIDALGGAYPTGGDYERGYAEGHGKALDDALAEIEKLGGRAS